MSVYVDQVREHRDPKRILFKHYCHMFADSETELVAFAVSIGMKAGWIQHEGTPRVHFDLTPTRRADALAAGASEIQTKVWLRDKRSR